jgi:general secretion pathway protein L
MQMQWLRALGAVFRSWTDSVAGLMVAGFDRVVSPRVVRLIETGPGDFSITTPTGTGGQATPIVFENGTFSATNLAATIKGSRAEIVLGPQRFLFRPFEFPVQAADFLDGMVRAQIDRLTPWHASEAAFGCSAPVRSGGDRVTAIVAATTRSVTAAYVSAISAFHPASVAIFTHSAEDPHSNIKVFEQKAQRLVDVARLSRLLLTGLGAAALCATLSAGAVSYVADRLDARRVELNKQVALRRAVILSGSEVGNGSLSAALERRKHENSADVITLDALSRVLPDNTYLTELHITGNKLQIVGISGDAPSLIRLIEQSPHFTRAIFFAPTTRSPADPADRFHIETRIEAINTLQR